MLTEQSLRGSVRYHSLPWVVDLYIWRFSVPVVVVPDLYLACRRGAQLFALIRTSSMTSRKVGLYHRAKRTGKVVREAGEATDHVQLYIRRVTCMVCVSHDRSVLVHMHVQLMGRRSSPHSCLIRRPSASCAR